MDHNHAVETQAIERYLLSQMVEEERDAFEAHYFSCAVCAQGVRDGARFRAGVRKASREAVPEAGPGWLGQWLAFPALVSTAAALLLLSVVAYQAGVVIPGLRKQLGGTASRAVLALALQPGTRGTGELPRIPSGTTWFTVYLDPPLNAAQPEYAVSVADAGGTERIRLTAPAPRRGEPLNLLLNGSRLSPGVYTLSLGPAAPAAQYRFQVD